MPIWMSGVDGTRYYRRVKIIRVNVWNAACKSWKTHKLLVSTQESIGSIPIIGTKIKRLTCMDKYKDLYFREVEKNKELMKKLNDASYRVILLQSENNKLQTLNNGN